jgi:hypothetical protein
MLRLFLDDPDSTIANTIQVFSIAMEPVEEQCSRYIRVQPALQLERRMVWARREPGFDPTHEPDFDPNRKTAIDDTGRRHHRPAISAALPYLPASRHALRVGHPCPAPHGR